MTSPHHDRPTSPATAGPGQPQYADRAYRSTAGVCGGILLLVLAGWLGGDAIARGTGHTPWVAIAALLLAVPLVVAFTVRPAVFANAERIRIRNPFRTITLPWTSVDALRASFSTELFSGSRKFQLWAIPVSLRARKRAARQDAWAKAAGDGQRKDAFGGARRRPPTPGSDGTVRSWSDQALADLRELSEHRPAPEDGMRGEPSIRWCYEIIAPAVAGAIVLIVLLAIG